MERGGCKSLTNAGLPLLTFGINLKHGKAPDSLLARSAPLFAMAALFLQPPILIVGPLPHVPLDEEEEKSESSHESESHEGFLQKGTNNASSEGSADCSGMLVEQQSRLLRLCVRRVLLLMLTKHRRMAIQELLHGSLVLQRLAWKRYR